jgi:hypothetical protein
MKNQLPKKPKKNIKPAAVIKKLIILSNLVVKSNKFYQMKVLISHYF